MQMGTMELIIVLLVAFLVLGPDKVSVYARKLGRELRVVRAYIQSMSDDLEGVTEPLREIREPLQELAKPVTELKSAVTSAADELKIESEVKL